MVKGLLKYVVPIALLALVSSAGQGEEERVPRSTLRVAVFDPWGDPLDGAEIQLLTLDREKNLAKSPQSRVIEDVPYGRYVLRVRIPSSVRERVILVAARQMWILASVPYVFGDTLWEGGTQKVTGQIFPAPRELTFVRIRGVFLDDQREALIDERGAFTIVGLESGLYVVEVFDKGGQLLHTRTVDLDLNRPTMRLKITLDRTNTK